jgi:hypothetical protein
VTSLSHEVITYVRLCVCGQLDRLFLIFECNGGCTASMAESTATIVTSTDRRLQQIQMVEDCVAEPCWLDAAVSRADLSGAGAADGGAGISE